MVLAAGLGTRLRPLTEEVPKPLVPVLGRPLVEHTLLLLRQWGVADVVLNLHHLPEAVPAALGDGSSIGLELRYVVEHGAILGTGGGVRGARPFLDDGSTFIVMNGDVLFAPDLPAALAHHRRLGALATMVVREDLAASAYGAVEIDADGRVRRLLGRPGWQGEPLRTTMFTGLHLLEPEVFDLLPETGCIVRGLYQPMLDAGRVIGAHVARETWVELGTVADYLRTNLALATGELRLPHLPPPCAGGLWLELGVTVARSDLLRPPVVVGRGATIRAEVERSVVWDGATVDEPVHDAVVTSRQVVHVGPRAGGAIPCPDPGSGRARR
jgi:mannose-1-phosphate guanylyltransferase